MRLIPLLIIVLSLFLLGCTAPEYNGPGASCNTSSFCAPGLACANGSCQPNTGGPAVPSLAPTATATPYKYPHSKVDIYSKANIYGPEDSALQPTVVTFAPGVDVWPESFRKIKSYGVGYVPEVSLWNNDQWKQVADLPPELSHAYAVDIGGKPIQSQHMVALNLNDPAMQKWFRDYVKRQHDGGADGLLFDETEGMAAFLSKGAPFDNYTMAGFAEYMNNSSFDYKEYLLSHGYRDAVLSDGDYPFKQEFRHYLESQANGFINRLIDYAESLWGNPYLSANYDPIWGRPPYTFASRLDDFTFEFQFTHPDWREATDGVRVTPDIRYTRHLNKRPIVMMWIGDYGQLAKMPRDEANRLVLRYLSETYASGGYFLYFDMDVPFEGNQFSADHSALAPYFTFIRDNPELFSGSWENTVAVPLVSHVDATRGMSMLLEDAHVPHTVVSGQPVGYTFVEPAEELGYHYYKTEDPADITKLKALYPGLDYWDAPAKVSIYPRGSSYHLVNYGAKRGGFNITVGLPQEGVSPAKATYYQPGESPTDAPLSLSGNRATITVPGLDIWGVVRLE